MMVLVMLGLRSSPRRFFLTIALGILALVVLGEFILRTGWRAALQDPWRQPAAWVAARLAVEGHPDLIYADGKIFAKESIRLGANPDIFAANAPTAILPFLPLTSLTVNNARTFWIFFSLLCFAVAWVILLEAMRVSLLPALALSVAVPLFQPLRRNIYLGEVYTLALLLSVVGSLLAVSAAKQDRASSNKQGWRASIVAGCSYALLCIVRQFYGFAQIFSPLLRRQWVIAGAAIGLYGAAVAATLVWLGSEPWLKSIQFSLAWREGPETAVTAYQSLNNFLTHLFRYHQTLNPGPILDIPWLVGSLWWVLALTILAASAYAIWRTQYRPLSTTAQRLLPYSLAIPLALLVAPISEDYHYAQTIFPLLVVGVVLWQAYGHSTQEKDKRRANTRLYIVAFIMLLAAILLLGLPWQFYNVPGTEGWKALLYYPRFYGNALLWALNLFLLLRPPAPLLV